MNKTTIVESQTKDNSSGKPSKRIRDDKPRKKDEKSVDHVLKALDSLGSTEEKLGTMCQKYAEMFNDHRMLQTAVKQAEKKNTLLQKEKEQLQAEHSKAILTRSRLENLCRELQRQNKAVKEECMLKMREEGEKKREVAAKFHSMLSEIGSLLAQNNDKNAKLRDDNLDMSMRLKSVCDQFEKKEQHVENLAKQMQLEMQLADAKLAKAKMEMDIEKETLQKEKQQLLIELADYKRKLVEMKASELALREQITMYSEKYEEFHKALLQSNSAIGEFKAEMERMTKHIRRLEKETATWKSRYDAAQRTLAEVTQGKIRSDEALGLSQRRLTALQGICRGLQDQCRQLRGETRRDSQTDEDYKRLEAQIKEVEQANDLDTQPCPRKVSSSSDTPNDAVIDPATAESTEISDQKSDATETIDDSSEPIQTSDVHNPEPSDIKKESESPKELEAPNVNESQNSDVIDEQIVIEITEKEVAGIQIDTTHISETEENNREEFKETSSEIEIEKTIEEVVNVNRLDQASPAEITCSKDNLKESVEELNPLKREEDNRDKLPIVTNSTSLESEAENNHSIEDCVNNLVNHIQEVSLLDDSSNTKEQILERVPGEPERISTPNKEVPNSINIVETVTQLTDNLTNNSEATITNHSNSNGNCILIVDHLTDESPKETLKDVLDEATSIISHDLKQVTSSPDDASSTKNKKKRKSKNNK